MNQIPGPAGNTEFESLHTVVSSAGLSLNCNCEEVLAKGDVVNIIRVTPGILGETSILIKLKGETFLASMTKGAGAKVGTLKPGDLLLIESDILPVSSKHYNPMIMVCLSSENCSKMREVDGDKIEAEVGCENTLPPQLDHVVYDTVRAQHRQEKKRSDCKFNGNSTDEADRAIGVAQMATTSTIRNGHAPALLKQKSQQQSLADDLYLFFSDSDDSGKDGKHGGTACPSILRDTFSPGSLHQKATPDVQGGPRLPMDEVTIEEIRHNVQLSDVQAGTNAKTGEDDLLQGLEDLF
jgi:hypothetical protein